jgi:hypothetical protein
VPQSFLIYSHSCHATASIPLTYASRSNVTRTSKCSLTHPDNTCCAICRAQTALLLHSTPMLRVVASHQPPLVFVNEAADGTTNFTGFLVDLLPMLLETAGLPLNYSIQAVPVSAVGNSSWSEPCAELLMLSGPPMCCSTCVNALHSCTNSCTTSFINVLAAECAASLTVHQLHPTLPFHLFQTCNCLHCMLLVLPTW